MPECPDWAIREASPEDARQLSLVAAATFLETFAGVLAGAAIVEHCTQANSAEAYGRHLRDGGRAWLAEIAPGGAPIGFALLTAPDLPGARAGDRWPPEPIPEQMDR